MSIYSEPKRVWSGKRGTGWIELEEPRVIRQGILVIAAALHQARHGKPKKPCPYGIQGVDYDLAAAIVSDRMVDKHD